MEHLNKNKIIGLINNNNHKNTSIYKNIYNYPKQRNGDIGFLTKKDYYLYIIIYNIKTQF